MSETVAAVEPVWMCWSGGKDSAMALRAVLQDPSLRVEALLTTVADDRISMHGVRRELLEAQAESIGLPLEIVRIPKPCSNDAYEAAMASAMERAKARGVSRMVFGDLFLEDIRNYRDQNLARASMSGIYPLWKRDTRKLAHECMDSGFKAILVCVDPDQLDPDYFCGREFDWPLLADLPVMADPCGERGEFHTFVYDGPIFKRPIPIRRGEVVERDGFWFCDLEHAPA